MDSSVNIALDPIDGTDISGGVLSSTFVSVALTSCVVGAFAPPSKSTAWSW